MNKEKRTYLRTSMAVVITVALLVTLTLTAAPAIAQWIPDSDIASGLTDVGTYSKPAVFDMDGTWYLIAGEYDGVFNGYNWTGTEWQSDPIITSGLLDVGYCSAPAVFNKDGTWYLITGEYDGVFTGYNWTGAEWQLDSGITAGLGGIGRNSAPAVFKKDGTWYLIAGEKGGAFFGYHWNETGSMWQPDSEITAGLAGVDSYSAPTVFEMTLHLISGNRAGAFNGYNWSGTEWQVDDAMTEGLEVVGDFSAPAVFQMGSRWYLISGNKAGTFNGYKFKGPVIAAPLDDWNGTWVNVGTMLDDPAMDAVYEAIADAANAAAGDGAFTSDDARSFLKAMLATNFGDLKIAGNTVTYYNADGTVRCECEYESAGAETVAFDGQEFDWYKFELTSEDAACSEYKYLIFTAVHSHADAMVHFHMRYGNTSFDDLIDNPNYAMWYPTFAVEGTTAEDAAEGYAERAEMLGYMMLASQRPTEWHVNEGESIQAAIDNASDGDTIIVHEGIYEEQLYIAKSLDLKAAEGESPEIRAPEPEELESYICNMSLLPGWTLSYSFMPIIMVEGSSSAVIVNISGFIINGSSVTSENSEHGICGIVYYNTSGIVENNEIENIWGLQNETTTPLIWNGDAVNVISSSNVTISRNIISDYTGSESAGIVVYDARATIIENTISGAKSVESPDQCGIEVGCGATATIKDNIVTGHLYNEHWWYSPGILFWDANGLIEGNDIGDNQVGIGIKTGWLRASSSIFIKDNIVNDSETAIRIATYKSWGSYYEAEPSITAIIEGNQLVGVSGSGIVIGDDVPVHNPLGTVTATITRNVVSGWDYGVKLLNCSNSTVYLNDFVNNTQNVFVNESTNVYNSPEKIDYTYEGRDYTNYVGNYWSDYDGEDANADGIGDTPYEITGDNPDRYPLMAPNKNYEQIGILVVAHGYPEHYSEDWCGPVRDAVEEMKMPYPTELGFLEFVPNQTINIAVDKLDEQGVTKIIAVPLFISSHSSHIAEIEYVLGLRETLPGGGMMSSALQETPPETQVISSTRTFLGGVEMERSIILRNGRYYISYTPISERAGEGVRVMQHGGVEEEELVPVDTTAEIVLANAIDNHTLIAQILADRAAEWCTNPTNETVVLVAHGTYNEAYFQGWVNDSKSLAEKVKLILRHSKGIEIEDVRYSFVFANPMVHPDLVTRAVVENVSETSHPIVLPLMISESFFTEYYIPEVVLKNLTYTYCEKELTPHPNVANWAEVTAAKELTYPTIPIYNDSQLLNVTIEEAGAYHGDICICLALGFRGTQLAIGDLWDVYEGEMPHQGDFKVISASPTKGIRDAFGYIMNATGDDYVLDLPPGTDKVNLTQDNFRATIIRKSTGESVTIQVKEGIFPDGFFELRKKVKFGIPENATAEEKKAFKLLWTETREKALYKPMSRVFEIAPPEKVGILAIAHGSTSESWCAPIRDAVENVSWQYPVELAFLEKVPNETINIAVDKLDEENVTKIIAVPMFISSSSGHIAEIEYILGLRDTPPEGEEGLVQVNTTAEIVLTSAMDNHSLIAQILTDRAAEWCVNATNETVVIVAHGTSTNETQFAGWNATLASLAGKVKLMLRHSKNISIEDVRYSFVKVNATLHPELEVRTVVEDVSTTSYPIVVPLFISEGYYTNKKIPKLLKNLSYAYPEKGKRALTPHDNVPNWIEISAYKEFTEEFGYPTLQIYDGEELLDITIEDVGKYHGEGEIEICPCVACAFRSTLRAFSEEELWGGVPHRGDMKIISAHPSDGHRMTFEYILNSTDDVVIQSPTDIINITADNYVYTFINKTTNESITLRVKESIFPERFFELRTKKKLGTATPEEKKALKLLWGKLLEKAMYKPMNRVFEEV